MTELASKKKGLFCVILGPDGSGKGAVISQVKFKFSNKYSMIKIFHWRPGFLPPLKNIYMPWKWKEVIDIPVTNPHGSKPSGYFFSLVRLLYYLFDFVIGYYLTTPKLVTKNALLIFDRYYYDTVIDPFRSRINLPSWFIKLFLPLIPKPDLTIYLDNQPDELYERKQELPVEELARQVKEWREFISLLPNARIVTTDKPLDDVVNEVTKLVLERRAEMTRKMLKIDPEESFYLWKSEFTDYIALPSKRNCRWIIPSNSFFAKRVWNLYLPYSWTGRAFKNIMKFMSANSLLKSFKFNKLNLELADESEELRKCIAEVFKRDDFVLALSTGTPGPFRKITAMIIAYDGKVLGYARIGETPLAIERIKNESNVLKLLANNYQLSGIGHHVSSIFYPQCLYEGEVGKSYVMIQTPASFEGESGDSMFNQYYAEVLSILIKNTMVRKKFKDSDFYKNLKQGIDTYPLSYRDILEGGLQYLEETIGDKEITFALSHGDFAPWNMLWNKDKRQVFLFDWESACFEAPAGIDLMHFQFQTGFLLKKLRGKKLFSFCIDEDNYKLLADKLEIQMIDCKFLLLTYLLKMAIDEDKPQQLSKSAVERRKLTKLLVNC